MRALAWRIAPRAAAAVVVALLAPIAPLWWVESGLADHGGALRSAPMSPLLVGLIAAGLALAAGAVVLAIVKVIARKVPPSE